MSAAAEGCQPHYVAYALAHGYADPADALAADKARSSGACMVPYILWIQGQWRAWDAANGETGDTGQFRLRTQEKFQAWLLKDASDKFLTTPDDRA